MLMGSSRDSTDIESKKLSTNKTEGGSHGRLKLKWVYVLYLGGFRFETNTILSYNFNFKVVI